MDVDLREDRKILYVMRGLPWCGKSYRAKQILDEHNGDGVIYSTDEYFYKILKPDRPDDYSFNPRFLADAHRWNRVRAQNAIERGVSPIIIDNTNTTLEEFLVYAEYAYYQDYEIKIEEPTTQRWMEISGLLKDKRSNKARLKEWAKKLEIGSKETHSVPFFAIERMMWRWQNNLTPEKVIESIIS